MPEPTLVEEKSDLRVCENCGVVYSNGISPTRCPTCGKAKNREIRF